MAATAAALIGCPASVSAAKHRREARVSPSHDGRGDIPRWARRPPTQPTPAHVLPPAHTGSRTQRRRPPERRPQRRRPERERQLKEERGAHRPQRAHAQRKHRRRHAEPAARGAGVPAAW
eukprot:3136617-Prymnesium_polylepis.1